VKIALCFLKFCFWINSRIEASHSLHVHGRESIALFLRLLMLNRFRWFFDLFLVDRILCFNLWLSWGRLLDWLRERLLLLDWRRRLLLPLEPFLFLPLTHFHYFSHHLLFLFFLLLLLLLYLQRHLYCIVNHLFFLSH